MHTLVLTGDDIQHLARHVGLDALMDEMIARLDAALRAYSPTATTILPRRGFVYDQPAMGLLEWMPCMSDGHVNIKVVGYHPKNVRRNGLPTILATVSEYDTATGHLTCLMDGTLLTALRTGAASAVASRVMARPDARTLGLIGAGAQAVTQLHALARTFDLDEVLICDADPKAEASFAERTATVADYLPIRVTPLDEIVQEADVICTATSIDVGEGPLFNDIEPKPWAHFNAVGSDFPGKTELPLSLLRRSFVCPDSPEQAVHEGECQQLNASSIGPSLHELMQHPDQYAHVSRGLSVFDSTGWALEDHVAMNLFKEYAAALGLGTNVAIEAIQDDAQNPYHFVQAGQEAVVP